MFSVSERLKQLRLQRGYTQDEIANYLNIHRTTYTKYESSRVPDVDSLQKIAQLYRISVDELLGNAPQRQTISAQSTFCAPTYYNDLDLGELSDDEKRMILLLRSCDDVDGAIYLVKKMILNDCYRDLHFESDYDMK